MNFQSGGGGAASKVSFWITRIFMILFSLPFAGFGVFAIGSGVKKLLAGDRSQGVVLTLFGVLFAAVGFGLMYAAVTAGKRQRAAEVKWQDQTDGGQKVWLARPDWAAGRIKSVAGAQTRIFLIMALVFLGIGGISTAVALPQELPKGNYKVLLVLIFPLAGLGFLIAVIRGKLAQRRFGDCFFELAQVPAPLGGTLAGEIQTARPLRLEQGLHLKLTCLRRTVSGSGDNQSTQEDVLWQDEKVLRHDACLPTTATGGTGIPVYFFLPGEQPESSLRGPSTIIWRLEAKAQMAGPDFSASFEVPVFRVAGAPVSAEAADPTAAMQKPVDELRREENSPIRVTDGPRGREFYFPAARNLVAAILVSLFAISATVGTAALIVNRVSYLAAAIVGLFAVIFGWLGFNLLFKSSRVIIDSAGVTLINRWLIFSRARRFEASEISRFNLKVGMTSGTKAYQDIKLVTRSAEENFAARKARLQRTGERPSVKLAVYDPAGVTLGSAIADVAEAKWLAQEMTKALGRRA